jgi:predicted 2-oxoglutarate/Fe(II)-dependent dioxygenase YbiX
MALNIGEAAPWFAGETASSPKFHLSAVAGRFVLLGFVPDAPRRDAALALIAAHRAAFDDSRLCAFLVVRDPQSIAEARDDVPGVRLFRDRDGGISRLYGFAGAEEDGGHWFLLDPTLRVVGAAPLQAGAALFERLSTLPSPDDHAGVPIHAPVLIVPRIFEPELCRRLIAFYEADGGAVSGVMREVNGRTVGVVDDFKSRRDAMITDEDFRRELRGRLARRLVPEIKKAFQFEITRLERYIVACYDAEDGGYFRPHRDNTTKGTAHRRFACSINLNAEAFEGGDLRFPEFGSRTYRPPTGGAVVFSCSLLHEATPVTRGRRYAFLPFFFDEPAEAIRQQNLQFLDVPSTQAAGPNAPANVQA